MAAARFPHQRQQFAGEEAGHITLLALHEQLRVDDAPGDVRGDLELEAVDPAGQGHVQLEGVGAGVHLVQGDVTPDGRGTVGRPERLVQTLAGDEDQCVVREAGETSAAEAEPWKLPDGVDGVRVGAGRGGVLGLLAEPVELLGL
jgi:hypothetical protein